jgi:NSS family neurotransmitter:Na+ symporter
MWSNRWLFILAAAGSAVGLGNIWKFPYIAGENGGGAFVLIYLVCVAFVGIPIMMAEVLIGREGRQSPINTMRKLTEQHHKSGLWTLIGWAGVVAGFLILSYYVVIAGWALFYVLQMGSGALDGATADSASRLFDEFLSDPWQMIMWQTIFMVMVVYIISKGVIKGLERAIRWFMPLLFVLLCVLLGYAVTSDGWSQGVEFMFRLDFSEVTSESVLIALGHMAYGAYLPSGTSIGSTVTIIALLDTAVAIAAGLAIFPIVFANGLEPSQGPGLMFVTVPLAFGQLPLGVVFGTLFFVLVSFAAITSAISISEPALAYLVEEYNAKRGRVAISLGAISWLLGIGTVLSFNVWADVHIVGQLTYFDFVDYVSQNVMLPLGGMFIALFAAYVLPNTVIGAQLGIKSGAAAVAWKVVCGVIAPAAVLVVFIATLFPDLFNAVIALF